MTIGSVVTHGFGAPGSAALVVTRGYSLGVATDANPYYTAEPPPTLRVDFYNNLTGAKLNVPPLANDVILGCNYQHKIGTIGTFTLQVAADAPAAQNAISGRRVWIYDGNYPVFKGVIRTREISVTSDGKLVLTLVGPSIADQLIGLTTGRGLVFEDDSLTTVVTSLVADTDFGVGSISTATIPVIRLDGRTKWDGLMAVAQTVACSVREDVLAATPAIDVGVFGDSTGITLRNFPQSSESLSGNPFMKQIAALKVKAQSLDLCNRVIPWGQWGGTGGSQFNLGRVSVTDNPITTTRLYLDRQDGLNPISPTAGTQWESASSQRWLLTTDRGSNAPEVKQTAASANDAMVAQFIYGPLGAQTLGGTVKAQFMALESGAAVNATIQLLIRVIAPDGTTVRGTTLAHGTYGNELNTSYRNITFSATALTAVDVEAGDYLVIELGSRHGTSGTSNYYIGNSGNIDLPENETETDVTRLPWIEFSQPIVLGATLPSGDEYEVLSRSTGGELEYYIEDAASQAIHGVRERNVYFKFVQPAGLTNLKFNAAAQSLYGMAVDFLTKHLAEQVAYEVEVMALRHVNPDTGLPYFKVGDMFRLQFDGWTQDNNGQPASYLDVDTDLYLLDFTVTYDAAGAPMTKLTLATFLRALPTDGEAIMKLAKDLGIEQASPLNAFVFGDDRGRLDDEGITLVAGASSAAKYFFLNLVTALRADADNAFPILAGGAYINGITELQLDFSAWLDDTGFGRFFVFGDTTTKGRAGIQVNRVSGNKSAYGYGNIGAADDGHFYVYPALYLGAVTADPTGAVSGQWWYRSDLGTFRGMLGSVARNAQFEGTGSTLTIASDAITVVDSYHVVDTEAAAATDNISTINGGRTGMRVVLRAANSARDVVVTEVGNCKLAGGTFTMNNVEDTIELIYDGTNWLELGRSDNGA